MAYVPTIPTTGSTYRFSLLAQLNGVAWNLAGATVTAIFTAPDDTITEHVCTVSGSTAYYDALITDLDQEGDWLIAWRVEQSGGDIESQGMAFGVLTRVAA